MSLFASIIDTIEKVPTERNLQISIEFSAYFEVFVMCTYTGLADITDNS